ncbi:Fic family protein [bacterium]|nr:Fic family protein [bacterium]MBU1957697.1 Fic family protein [bacterium]
MNLKNYKSGTLKEQYQYKSFTPSTINHTFVWDDPKINTMLEDATRALGELNAFTMIVPNVDMFIQMHITKKLEIISSYQFETIHPFLDGNGRIGRVLITLYLVSNGLLKKPSLYLSDFIEKHKQEYYDRLSNTRELNDLTNWIKFFLEAIISTANSGVETFQKILALKMEMDREILGFGKKAQNAGRLIEFLYQKPIVSVSEVVKVLGVSKPTANNLIKEFEAKEILREVTGYQRNKHYAFERYVEIYSKS